jgi:multiple sugar transport system substrate-binding protein
MYSNKAFLDQASIATDANGELAIASAADLTAILDKLKAVVGDGNTALALPQTGDDPYRVWWATYFQMGGTPLVSDDGGQVSLDKAKAVAAADFVKSLYTDGYVAPGITDHQKMFQEGKAGLMFGGTWAVGAFEATSGLQFTPQDFPSLFNNSQAAWADSHVLTIPTKAARSDEDTQAAVNFISWAASSGGLTWAQSGQIPANSTVTASADYLALPYRSDYMGEKDVAVLPSQNEHFYALKDTMIKNLDTIWTDQADSASAIDNMVDEMGSDLQ